MRFKKGDLFEVVVRNLNLTREGFATGEKIGKDLLLHEQIDLHAYPSCNDFFGKITKVPAGTKATVIRYIGRPDRISRNPRWFDYDVYEILVLGEVRQIFKQTDYSKKGRENNIRAANTVATYINNVQNVDVIIALVNPYERLRAELRANNLQVIEILLESDRDLRREYHVENFEIGHPEHIINTDSLPDDTWNLLRNLLDKRDTYS